jgi:dephospho-CoA kinase
MMVIGLTGGIGTGKSEVARMLSELGAVMINADQVGHEAYTPNSEIWREVVEAFGEGILLDTGEIDRQKLGAIVFAQPEQLTKLNQIMHPRMARMVEQGIQELRDQGVSVVVVEAALLFEAGWDTLVDEVWVTNSGPGQVVPRLQARTGLDEQEIRKRIDSQMPAEERLSRSDVVVDNSGNLAALRSTVKSLWDSRVKEIVEKV